MASNRTRHSIKLCAWNANSISPKINEFRHFVKEECIDICLVNETHLKHGVKASVPNYKCYRNDRPTAGGGTLIYVKNSIVHHQTLLQNLKSIEATAIVVKTAEGPITIISAYHQPGKQFDNEDFEKLIPQTGATVIAGDLNSKHPDWHSRAQNTNGKSLRNALLRLGAKAWGPENPTHYPANLKQRPDVLDIVISKNIYENIAVESIGKLTSDHNPIIFNLEHEKTETAQERNYNKTNWTIFKTHLENSLSPIDENKGVSHNATKWSEQVLEAANKAAPMRKHNRKTTSLPKEIIELIRLKNRARKLWQDLRTKDNRASYNKSAREVRQALQKQKIDDWDQRVQNLRTEDGTAWGQTRSFLRLRHKIPILHGEQGLAYKDEDKANALADAFEKNFRPVAEPYCDRHIDRVSQFLRNYDVNDDEVELEADISTEEVEQTIRSLRAGKAPGKDKVSNLILKNLPKIAIRILTDLFNKIIRTRRYPANWKNALIVAIKKPGKEAIAPQSYRPISLLPAVSKLFERLLLKRLLPEIERLNLIPQQQFGFRAGKSTTHQLMRVVEEITDGFNRNRHSGILALDVTAAFDSVWHNGLLYKLANSGLKKGYVMLVASYLHNRTFEVKVGDKTSTTRKVKAGVPQGSVLGPILYNLYTADIPTTEQTTSAFYADDSAYIASSLSPQLIETRLQDVLTKIERWATLWRVKINAEKSQCVLLSKRSNRHQLNLRLFDKNIQQTPTVKYLGVTLDRQLTWKQHITNIIEKVKTRMGILYPILNENSKLPEKQGIRLYCALIRPIIEYASPVWCYASTTTIDKLQKKQNIALRRALKLPRTTNANVVHHLANIQDIYERFYDNAARFYRKCWESKHDLIRNLGNYDPELGKYNRPRSYLM